MSGDAEEVVEVPSLAFFAPGLDAVMDDAPGLDVVMGGGSGASSSGAGAEPPPAVPEPWMELTGPSATGYFSLGVRSVLRIQRGKPAYSVTVNCYRHVGCRLLIAQSRCPDDEALKRWLFEVHPPAADAPAAEKKHLATDHMNIGKARWFAPRAGKSL